MVSTVVTTVVLLIFSENSPKYIAKMRAESIAKRFAEPLHLITKLLATLVYLLEFIVGDIFDEYDVYREDLKIIEPDKKIQVEGLTAIQDILDFFEMDNPDIWISFTVVGLIMEEMGRIPQLGDDCKIEGLHFKVIESEKGRIKRVNIKQVLNQPIESIK